MGISIEAWRAKIGTFSQPVKKIFHMNTLKPRHISLCIRVVLFLMLITQCVVPNPGPGPGTSWRAPSGRQSTSGSGPSRPTLQEQVHDQRELRSATKRSSEMHTENQNSPSLTTWLRKEGDLSRPKHTSGSNIDVNPSDPTAILLEIHRDVKSLNSKFDSLDATVEELKEENRKLAEQNKNLTSDVATLKDQVQCLQTNFEKNSKRQEKIESQNKRKNLKFYDIDQNQNESPEETERKVKKAVKDLDIDDSKIKIERAYRLPSRSSPSPILVEFSSLKTRDEIIKSFKDKRKGGDDISFRVGEDFPERVSRARSGLYPFLKECHESRKHAYYKYDCLIVEGQKYVFDDETKSVIRAPNSRRVSVQHASSDISQPSQPTENTTDK
jgi:regulator of replication initiation timing